MGKGPRKEKNLGGPTGESTGFRVSLQGRGPGRVYSGRGRKSTEKGSAYSRTLRDLGFGPFKDLTALRDRGLTASSRGLLAYFDFRTDGSLPKETCIRSREGTPLWKEAEAQWFAERRNDLF